MGQGRDTGKEQGGKGRNQGNNQTKPRLMRQWRFIPGINRQSSALNTFVHPASLTIPHLANLPSLKHQFLILSHYHRGLKLFIPARLQLRSRFLLQMWVEQKQGVCAAVNVTPQHKDKPSRTEGPWLRPEWKDQGTHQAPHWWAAIWPHTELWFPSTLIIRELGFAANVTLMKRNDANVTLMNRNDSSGLIKISPSSSAQDQPEGLDT